MRVLRGIAAWWRGTCKRCGQRPSDSFGWCWACWDEVDRKNLAAAEREEAARQLRIEAIKREMSA